MTLALLFIVCVICSAICGRAGGISKEARSWIPQWIRHSPVRDWLCPLWCLLPIGLTQVNHFNLVNMVWLVLFYGFLGLSLTTYYDTLWGYDNFWFAGLMAGLSGYFLAPVISWWIILIRMILLGVGWGLIHCISQKDKWRDGKEEYVRYGYLALTTITLL